MALWEPLTVLANFELAEAIEAEPTAFASIDDSRVRAINAAHPIHATFLDRFADAFGEKRCPTVLLLDPSASESFRSVNAIASIRDILSVSVVPRARARHIMGKASSGIFYARTFDFYPWMIDRNYEWITAVTPGVGGVSEIDRFHGQAAPEVPFLSVLPGNVDKPLFQALVQRWRSHYDSREAAWENVKLMRSLNMAYHASQPPACQDTTIFDYGRLMALWVSAFEILVHPGEDGRADQWKVYNLLKKVNWNRKENTELDCGRPRCLYRRLHDARNDFLHGNPVESGQLSPPGTQANLFQLAAPLYRMALTAFLDLGYKKPHDLGESVEEMAREITEKLCLGDYQDDFEEAIASSVTDSASTE